MSMKHLILLLSGGVLILQSCAVRPFASNSIPQPPDYSISENWAALPGRADNADRTPDSSLKDLQGSAQVDVLFLHPTIFWKKSDKHWNGSLADAKLNQKVDETTILFQPSIFNGAGRVFAPRYRQAHLRSFFTSDKQSADKALELAYSDIRQALRR